MWNLDFTSEMLLRRRKDPALTHRFGGALLLRHALRRPDASRALAMHFCKAEYLGRRLRKFDNSFIRSVLSAKKKNGTKYCKKELDRANGLSVEWLPMPKIECN
jgi:hypothetical protein